MGQWITLIAALIAAATGIYNARKAYALTARIERYKRRAEHLSMRFNGIAAMRKELLVMPTPNLGDCLKARRSDDADTIDHCSNAVREMVYAYDDKIQEASHLLDQDVQDEIGDLWSDAFGAMELLEKNMRQMGSFDEQDCWDRLSMLKHNYFDVLDKQLAKISMELQGDSK